MIRPGACSADVRKPSAQALRSATSFCPPTRRATASGSRHECGTHRRPAVDNEPAPVRTVMCVSVGSVAMATSRLPATDRHRVNDFRSACRVGVPPQRLEVFGRPLYSSPYRFQAPHLRGPDIRGRRRRRGRRDRRSTLPGSPQGRRPTAERQPPARETAKEHDDARLRDRSTESRSST